MSSKKSGSKVRIEVPKVRRNMAEVRPYNEVPGPGQRSEQILLWGTALGLFLVLMAGGVSLWRWNQQPALVSQDFQTTLSAKEILQEANRHFIDGDSEAALTQAEVALALELANPSEPTLEPAIRKSMAIAYQEQRNYSQAANQWLWLKRSHPELVDATALETCQQKLNQSQESMALEQLHGSQELLIQGHAQRALAEARQARRALESSQAAPASRQAAHLVVANIALQQGNPKLALLELQEARKLGPLSQGHLALLSQLQQMQSSPPKVANSRPLPTQKMQVQVDIPRLGTGPSYPVNTGKSRPRPAPKPRSEAEEIAQDEAAAPPPKPKSKAPGLELPKLRYPNQGSSAASAGSLPSYRDQGGDSFPGYQDQSGSSLPGYNSKTRAQDRLPGY